MQRRHTMSLYEEISELIDLKTEGDYWDVKVQWHENKADHRR